MKNKPIIGIIGCCEIKNDKTTIKLDDDIRRAVIKSGGIPKLILPLCDNDYQSKIRKNKINAGLKKIDGIIITGGDKWYDFDMLICEYAIKKDIPLLGICRGMQMIVSCINKEYKDVSNNQSLIKIINKNHNVLNNDAHEVFINKQTKLYKVVKKEHFWVNSRHNYKVNLKENPQFKISAFSSDGIIEGIELSNKKFIIGVQWHPENIIDRKENLELFKELINECTVRRNNAKL